MYQFKFIVCNIIKPLHISWYYTSTTWL